MPTSSSASMTRRMREARREGLGFMVKVGERGDEAGRETGEWEARASAFFSLSRPSARRRRTSLSRAPSLSNERARLSCRPLSHSRAPPLSDRVPGERREEEEEAGAARCSRRQNRVDPPFSTSIPSPLPAPSSRVRHAAPAHHGRPPPHPGRCGRGLAPAFSAGNLAAPQGGSRVEKSTTARSFILYPPARRPQTAPHRGRRHAGLSRPVLHAVAAERGPESRHSPSLRRAVRVRGVGRTASRPLCPLRPPAVRSRRLRARPPPAWSGSEGCWPAPRSPSPLNPGLRDIGLGALGGPALRGPVRVSDALVGRPGNDGSLSRGPRLLDGGNGARPGDGAGPGH